MQNGVYNYVITKTHGQNPQRKKENKMKKIISLILAFATLVCAMLAFTSCGGDDLYKAYGKQLDKVKAPTDKAETLTVAMSPDFAPMEFSYINGADSEVAGFDVLLANYLAKELGMNLEIKPMSFDACQIAIGTGTVDLAISGFSWTADRAENYLISNYYIAGDNETEQVLITTKANEDKLKNASDYAGLKIGYQGASLQELLVNETFAGIAGELVPYGDLGLATVALQEGKIDALAVAQGNGESIIANTNGTLAFSGFEFEVDPKYENNVVLLNKADAELLAKVNAALDKALANDYYTPWYESCLILAGSKSIDELGYDDEGNKITE
jgi:polar amino acid transport system substrate-binding protein